MLTALELAGAAPPDSALAALAAPLRDSRDTFMPLLVNALAELPQQVVLVLDDVHVLRNRECHTQLAFLVLHAPDTLRLVMTARSDPSLPLHVLRVRGRLIEIRATDLAFTHEECDQLLRAHGLELDSELVAALHTRTEGWGAGLRLAALSLQGREDPERFVAEFAGDDRVVGDYLLAEVLDRQPPRLRSFLLRTSLVDRVCGGLADALTGDSHGADTLATLERTNGFVLGVDGHREWFRYHRLFAKLLRTRAERELRDELAALHGRAARWYAADGAAVDALKHAVAAQEWDLAVEVVAEHWFDLYVRGDAPAVRRLAAQLPAEHTEGDAELAAALACAALDVGDVDLAELHVAHAEVAAAGLPEARRPRYLETMALANLATARLEGDFEGALEAADALLAEAATHPRAAGDDAREALVHAMLGESALWGHRLDRAGEELRKAVTLARLHRLDYVAVSALSDLALLEVMQDGPAFDHAHADEAIALAARRGWSQIPQTTCAHTALALGAFYDLDPQAAGEHLVRARASAAHMSKRQLEFVIAHLDARLQGALGNPRAGLRTLEEFETLHRFHGTPPPYEDTSLASMRARLQIAAGELEAAEATLASVADDGWLAVDYARGAPGDGAGRAGRGGRDPRRRAREERHPRGRRRRARGPGGHRPRRGRRAGPRRHGAGRGAGPGRDDPPPLAVPGARAADGGAAAAPDPYGNRAPRGGRGVAGRVRGPRADRADGLTVARATVRARAGDPALPADGPLEPRDRGGAVRHHEHGEDAPAVDLPQAGRGAAARGRGARSRPAAFVGWVAAPVTAERRADRRPARQAAVGRVATRLGVARLDPRAPACFGLVRTWLRQVRPDGPLPIGAADGAVSAALR